MMDFAKQERQALIQGAPKTNAQKLEAAKAYLGKNWVLHPEYRTNPRHAVHARPLRLA